jgi:hypothetical protein
MGSAFQSIIFVALSIGFLYLTWSNNLKHPSMTPLFDGSVKDVREFGTQFFGAFRIFFSDALVTPVSRLATSHTLFLSVSVLFLFHTSKYQVFFFQLAFLGAAAAAFPLFLSFWNPSAIKPVSKSPQFGSWSAWFLAITLAGLNHFMALNHTHPYWNICLWAFFVLPWFHVLFTRSVGAFVYPFLAGASVISLVSSIPDLIDLASVRSFSEVVAQATANPAALSLCWDYIGLTVAALSFVLFDNAAISKKLPFLLLVPVVPSVFFPLYLVSRDTQKAQ